MRNQLSFIADCLNSAQEELREISHGLYPSSLSRDGLVPALRNLARLSRVPVEVEVGAYREVPKHLQAAIYHIVSEALANAAKHAHAFSVAVVLDIRDGLVQLSVTDDDHLKGRARTELGDEDRYLELTAGYPLGRPATPREVADLIVFLTSERSAYTSGAVFTVDGGLSATA